MEAKNEFVIEQPNGANEEIIHCHAKHLQILVIPPSKRPADDYPKDMLIISAHFYGRIGEQVDVTQDTIYDFAIIRPDRKPKDVEWTMTLFYDAIWFYAQLKLDREPDGLTYGNHPGFYPFGGE